MTEVKDAFDGAFLHMLDDPLEVLGLQVGDAHMTYDTFLLQSHEGGQRLVAYLLQTSLQTSLKLDVVHIDQVDIVDIQSLHTLIDAVRDALGTVVPGVHAVFAVATYLCGEEILVARNLLQSLA